MAGPLGRTNAGVPDEQHSHGWPRLSIASARPCKRVAWRTTATPTWPATSWTGICGKSAVTTTRSGRYVLAKAGPGRLIDGCVAAVLAHEAAAQIQAPVKPAFALV